MHDSARAGRARPRARLTRGHLTRGRLTRGHLSHAHLTAGFATAAGSGKRGGDGRAEHLTGAAPHDQVGDVVDLVKTYAKQETVGPLKGAGRFLGFGVAGAVALGIGGILVLLGLLRLVQTELDRTARGSLSWLAYLIVLVAAALGAVLAASRIKRDTLDKPRK